MKRFFYSLALPVVLSVLIVGCNKDREDVLLTATHGDIIDKSGIDSIFVENNIAYVSFENCEKATLNTQDKNQITAKMKKNIWYCNEGNAWWCVQTMPELQLISYSADSEEGLWSKISTNTGERFADLRDSTARLTPDLAPMFRQYYLLDGLYKLKCQEHRAYSAPSPYRRKVRTGATDHAAYFSARMDALGDCSDEGLNAKNINVSIRPNANGGYTCIIDYDCAS